MNMEPKVVRTQAQREASHRYYLHLMQKHPMKYIWLDIMARTGHRGGASPQKLAWYKERGIDICAEWRDFRVFEEWCMKNGWAKGLQLDRIDNDKGYCPGNCRFVTASQNQRNKSNTRRWKGIAVAYYYDAYANKSLLRYDVFKKRLKAGWCMERALYTRPRKGRWRKSA